MILRPQTDTRKNRVFTKINNWIAKGNNSYVSLISVTLKHKKAVMMSFIGMIVLIFVINKFMPSSFLPVEDQGYFTVELELPKGATLERTREITDRAVTYLMENPAVKYVQSVAGSSGQIGSSQERSLLTVILKPWEERDDETIDDIMAVIRRDLSQYPECKVYLSKPPVIPGLGSSGGFELQLEARGDATLGELQAAADTLMKYASGSKEITGLSTSLQSEIPQLYFDVNRDKVMFSGVPLADVFSTMKAYTGSVYVNDFNMFTASTACTYRPNPIIASIGKTSICST